MTDEVIYAGKGAEEHCGILLLSFSVFRSKMGSTALLVLLTFFLVINIEHFLLFIKFPWLPIKKN